jgi:hypothetical protein
MSFSATRSVVAAVLSAAIATPLGSASVRGQTGAVVTDEPILGTWVLDVPKSVYRPGPAPRSQTRTYEVHPEGIKTTVRTTDADGHDTEIHYVAKYDGIEYPITGSAEADAIALRRIDAFIAEATLTHAGRVIGTARRVISKDGTTMTITFQGGDTRNVAVYEKQK